jgi:hypothetical protein
MILQIEEANDRLSGSSLGSRLPRLGVGTSSPTKRITLLGTLDISPITESKLRSRAFDVERLGHDRFGSNREDVT